MVKKTEERKESTEEMKDIFKTWADSYTVVSKMWEDSYLKLYKPWIESTGEMFEKAAELSTDATPEKYKEFYDEWVKIYQNSFGKFYPIPTIESNKETLEKLLASTEESNKLYSSWIAALEENSRKTKEILQGEPDPAKYKECYDEWVKIYQNSFGKFYPIPTIESNKETLEKLLASTEESNKLYSSWIAELEENSRKTKEILQGEPDPAKYKECYDMWIKSYEKIFDEFLTLPAMESTKEIFEKYTGLSDIDFGGFVQISKLWRNSYAKLYEPWIESVLKLSRIMAELSRGDADPEAYTEFYNIWMDTYKETYGKHAQSTRHTKEVFDSFVQSTDIYLNMYKSRVAALEKMAEKTMDISKRPTDPEASKQFYNLWMKMYKKAFESFFEDRPLFGPMKEMTEPVKIMAKLYADTFAEMSRMWVISGVSSASAYPGKNI